MMTVARMTYKFSPLPGVAVTKPPGFDHHERSFSRFVGTMVQIGVGSFEVLWYRLALEVLGQNVQRFGLKTNSGIFGSGSFLPRL